MMKYVFSILFDIAVIIVSVCVVIKGLRFDYWLTTLVGILCTLISVVILIWGIYEHFKDMGRHGK